MIEEAITKNGQKTYLRILSQYRLLVHNLGDTIEINYRKFTHTQNRKKIKFLSTGYLYFYLGTLGSVWWKGRKRRKYQLPIHKEKKHSFSCWQEGWKLGGIQYLCLLFKEEEGRELNNMLFANYTLMPNLHLPLY